MSESEMQAELKGLRYRSPDSVIEQPLADRYVKRRALELANDEKTEERISLALEFEQVVVALDEEPASVSYDATLRDVSLAPDADLIRKVENRSES